MEILLGKILIGIWCFAGIFIIALGVSGIRSGYTYFGAPNLPTQTIYRNESPITFWMAILSWFTIGVVFLISGIWCIVKWH